MEKPPDGRSSFLPSRLECRLENGANLVKGPIVHSRVLLTYECRRLDQALEHEWLMAVLKRIRDLALKSAIAVILVGAVPRST